MRNELFLGVETVYSSWVETNVVGRDASIRPGEVEEVCHLDQRCTVALVSIDDDGGIATFQIACSGSQ